MADRRMIAAVFAGGAVGTLAAGGVECGVSAPRVTVAVADVRVNIVGAFLLGYFTTRLQERLPLSSYRRPALGTGLCGGLTTFSTMQVEIVKMLDGHHFGLALGYAAASLAAGYAAIQVATALVRRVRIGV